MTYYVEVFTSSTGKKQNERVVTRRSCQSLGAVNDALAVLWPRAASPLRLSEAQLLDLPLEQTEGIGAGYRGVRVRR